jgi:hypothetical protein
LNRGGHKSPKKILFWLIGLIVVDGKWPERMMKEGNGKHPTTNIEHPTTNGGPPKGGTPNRESDRIRVNQGGLSKNSTIRLRCASSRPAAASLWRGKQARRMEDY